VQAVTNSGQVTSGLANDIEYLTVVLAYYYGNTELGNTTAANTDLSYFDYYYTQVVQG
jgi:hypothetical protein